LIPPVSDPHTLLTNQGIGRATGLILITPEELTEIHRSATRWTFAEGRIVNVNRGTRQGPPAEAGGGRARRARADQGPEKAEAAGAARRLHAEAVRRAAAGPKIIRPRPRRVVFARSVRTARANVEKTPGRGRLPVPRRPRRGDGARGSPCRRLRWLAFHGGRREDYGHHYVPVPRAPETPRRHPATVRTPRGSRRRTHRSGVLTNGPPPHVPVHPTPRLRSPGRSSTVRKKKNAMPHVGLPAYGAQRRLSDFLPTDHVPPRSAAVRSHRLLGPRGRGRCSRCSARSARGRVVEVRRATQRRFTSRPVRARSRRGAVWCTSPALSNLAARPHGKLASPRASGPRSSAGPTPAYADDFTSQPTATPGNKVGYRSPGSRHISRPNPRWSPVERVKKDAPFLRRNTRAGR